MIRAEYFLRNPVVHHSPGLIKNPEVSVVLPTYCRGDNGLLSGAVESVLSQSFQSFELIVMDDGSTDGTRDVLSEFVRTDDRVIHVRHEMNSGLPALRVNEGLLRARGTFCAYQFDDDRWTDIALETLVSNLKGRQDYHVAYGKARVKLNGEEQTLGRPFNYSELIYGNYIANNSVMHYRSVFERYGGFDMHLVMRRSCDWDLWLRWARAVRFLFVDATVSLVNARMDKSLGKTVHYDLMAVRSHMAHDRNASLTPGELKDYPVDNLKHLSMLGKDKTAQIWRQLIAPFQSLQREILPVVLPKREVPVHVIVIKEHFDTTVDITINNFQQLLDEEFKFTYVPLSQMDEAAIECADILLFHRLLSPYAKELMQIAHKKRKCIVFLMDDDLLTLHELSDEFAYLAPGAINRQVLEALIRGADLVVTYSKLMQDSVMPLNPRNVRMKTNIQSERLIGARSKIKEPQTNDTSSDSPVRIAFAGGYARKEELAFLRPAIVEVSRRLKDRAEFHFWGISPEGIEDLQSAYHCESFSYSYEEYLSRLVQSNFDVMIAPLFGEKKAKRAKCPIKFLEITAAGAIGVYSDVEPYAVVLDGESGIKCKNTVEAWTEAILKAVKLGRKNRRNMLAAALKQIEQDFTSEVLAPGLRAILDAALLHGQLRNIEISHMPRIAYFCHSPYRGGAENHLLRHALIAQSFRFHPILVLPESFRDAKEDLQCQADAAGIAVDYLPFVIETEIDDKRTLDEKAISEIRCRLEDQQISLVHSVTVIREVGEAARRAGVPHVASLYATESIDCAGVKHCDIVHSDSLLYTNRWSEIFGVPGRRILSHIPEDYFRNGKRRKSFTFSSKNAVPTIGMFGTVQPRKGQLQAIEAVGMLIRDQGIEVDLKIYGYEHFFPDYIARCKNASKHHDIESHVFFEGFIPDAIEILHEMDIVLCASDWESLPQAVLEGMAAQRLVVTTSVGGVEEVLSDRSGIVIPDNSPKAIRDGLLKALRLSDNELKSRLGLAYNVVRGECSRDSVAVSLFRLYSEAVTVSCSENSCTSKQGFVSDERILFDGLERVRKHLHAINTGNRTN